MKKIFITNGMARCGKDTFSEFLNEYIPTTRYSSIDVIKEIARKCGWDGSKRERDRKFLSDLKVLTSEYNSLSFISIKNKIGEFLNDQSHEVMLIDIREPKEIDRVSKEFEAKTILIKNDRVKNITSNMADKNVFNYEYDYQIENNGTLEEFREVVKKFAENIMTKEGGDAYDV